MIVERPEKLSVIFTADCISGLDVFNTVLQALADLNLQAKFSVHGAEVGVKDLKTKIMQKNSWPSGVSLNGVCIKFGVLPALEQCFVVLEETTFCKNKFWGRISEYFIFVEGFVQAWISNLEYDYWQNANDPLEFQIAGRAYAHLPQKSNGLPPPLDQVEIDTSMNPGRTELKEGYVQAIGRLMWLSNVFWEKVGTEKLTCIPFLEKEGFSVSELENGVNVISCHEEFFDESNSRKQIFLRNALFGSSASHSLKPKRI